MYSLRIMYIDALSVIILCTMFYFYNIMYNNWKMINFSNNVHILNKMDGIVKPVVMNCLCVICYALFCKKSFLYNFVSGKDIICYQLIHFYLCIIKKINMGVPLFTYMMVMLFALSIVMLDVCYNNIYLSNPFNYSDILCNFTCLLKYDLMVRLYYKHVRLLSE